MNALSVEEWSAERNKENHESIEDVLEGCMGLITVHNDDTVHFNHLTAERYLIKQPQILPQSYIAGICLTYLLMDHGDETGNFCITNPFFRYAAVNVTLHIKS